MDPRVKVATLVFTGVVALGTFLYYYFCEDNQNNNNRPHTYGRGGSSESSNRNRRRPPNDTTTSYEDIRPTKNLVRPRNNENVSSSNNPSVDVKNSIAQRNSLKRRAGPSSNAKSTVSTDKDNFKSSANVVSNSFNNQNDSGLAAKKADKLPSKSPPSNDINAAKKSDESPPYSDSNGSIYMKSSDCDAVENSPVSSTESVTTSGYEEVVATNKIDSDISGKKESYPSQVRHHTRSKSITSRNLTPGCCSACEEMATTKFLPCEHSVFCKKHAEMYLKIAVTDNLLGKCPEKNCGIMIDRLM